MKARFSVPWNGDKALGKRLLALAPPHRKRIAEIYFAPPGDICPSGRKTIAVVDDVERRLKDFLSPLLEAGMGVNLLLNATAFGGNLFEAHCERLLRFLDTVPVTHVTVVDWRMAHAVKKYNPAIQVVASVNCQVNSPLKAVYYHRLGADELTVDRDINWNLSLLGEIRKACPLPLRVMVNEGCLCACPLKATHDACIGLDAAHGCPIKNIPGLQKDPLLTALHSPVVRPEELHHYEGIVDRFKIVDRALSTDQIMRLVMAYIEERYAGDFLELANIRYRPGDEPPIPNSKIPRSFFPTVSSCRHDCDKCRYCSSLLESIRNDADSRGSEDERQKA